MKAKLLLHQKYANLKECCCGSKLRFVNEWVCERQFRKKERSWVYVEFDGRLNANSFEDKVIYYEEK